MKDFTRMNDLLNRFVEQGTNPGCAVAVMQGDELIYHGEAGYANIEAGKKVDLHSMFSQASTTKLFTYVILGMIYEEGKFLFSDPLETYLPEWKNTRKSQIDNVVIWTFLGSNGLQEFGIVNPLLVAYHVIGSVFAVGSISICTRLVGKGQRICSACTVASAAS